MLCWKHTSDDIMTPSSNKVQLGCQDLLPIYGLYTHNRKHTIQDSDLARWPFTGSWCIGSLCTSNPNPVTSSVHIYDIHICMHHNPRLLGKNVHDHERLEIMISKWSGPSELITYQLRERTNVTHLRKLQLQLKGRLHHHDQVCWVTDLSCRISNKFACRLLLPIL